MSDSRPARLLGGVMDWLANADAGLVGTVFAVLIPVVLVASLLYFDLFGLGMILRDLTRVVRGMEDIVNIDPDINQNAGGGRSLCRGRLPRPCAGTWRRLVPRAGPVPSGKTAEAVKNNASAFGEPR
jgi:hypothetical protein